MPNPVLFSSQSDEEIAWNDNRNQGNQNQKHQTLKQGTSGAVGANNDLHELHMVLYATSERGLSFLPLFACPTFVSARSCKKIPPSLDEWKSLSFSTPSTPLTMISAIIASPQAMIGKPCRMKETKADK